MGLALIPSTAAFKNAEMSRTALLAIDIANLDEEGMFIRWLIGMEAKNR
jgi:hypothetical protein